MVDTKVSKFMTGFPYSVNPKTTLAQTLNQMEEHKIRHMPVIDDKKIVGIISERDIKAVEPFVQTMDLLVSDAMVKNPYSVSHDTPITQVLETMESKKYGCCLIKTASEQVLGIFTTIDAIKLLRRILQDRDEMKPVGDFIIYN